MKFEEVAAAVAVVAAVVVAAAAAAAKVRRLGELVVRLPAAGPALAEAAMKAVVLLVSSLEDNIPLLAGPHGPPPSRGILEGGKE